MVRSANETARFEFAQAQALAAMGRRIEQGEAGL
jgi:hypothetical protein